MATEIKILTEPYIAKCIKKIEVKGATKDGKVDTFFIEKGDLWLSFRSYSDLNMGVSDKVIAFVNNDNDIFFLRDNGGNRYLPHFTITGKYLNPVERMITSFDNDEYYLSK